MPYLKTPFQRGLKAKRWACYKLNSIEVRNALEMLEENLCLYQEKCNDMRDFLQRLESLHALDETNASKQSRILTSLLQDSKNQ